MVPICWIYSSLQVPSANTGADMSHLTCFITHTLSKVPWYQGFYPVLKPLHLFEIPLGLWPWNAVIYSILFSTALWTSPHHRPAICYNHHLRRGCPAKASAVTHETGCSDFAHMSRQAGHFSSFVFSLVFARCSFCLFITTGTRFLASRQSAVSFLGTFESHNLVSDGENEMSLVKF